MLGITLYVKLITLKPLFVLNVLDKIPEIFLIYVYVQMAIFKIN
jgi:hypothetical protein